MNKRYRVFTLIEVVIVIAILSVLLAIGLPNVISMKNKAEVNNVTTTLAAMFRDVYEAQNQEMAYNRKYYIDIYNYTSSYPDSLIIREMKNDGSKKILKELKSDIVSLEISPDNNSFVNLNYNISFNFDNIGQINKYKDDISNSPSKVRHLEIKVRLKDNQSFFKVIALDAYTPGSVVIK